MAVFWVGIVVNLACPLWYSYFSFKVAKGYTQDDPEEWIGRYDERFHIGKYLIGIVQSVSATFMMIAIHRIAKSVRRDRNLADDLNQNMLILHQVTFTAYLIATIIQYIVYAGWDRLSSGGGNAVYISGGIAVIMSAISQCVLIFIYWGLGSIVIDAKEPVAVVAEEVDEELQTEVLAFDDSEPGVEEERAVGPNSMLQIVGSADPLATK